MMNDDSNRPFPSGKSQETRSAGGRGPPTSAVLIVLALIGIACFAGYFLLMKLIDVSREDDCLLAHRRDCGAIQVPNNGY
jgi:hypothetical protein